jgi:4-amino-4-deoxy-L-arabinose transferase-like glycosyltransferase
MAKKKSKPGTQSSGGTTPVPQVYQDIPGILLRYLQKYDFVILFILLFLAFNTTNSVGLISGDTAPATILPLALLENHNVYLDFATGFINSPDYSYAFRFINGHYVSLFPIVTPVLVTPVYAVSIFLSSFIADPYGELWVFYFAKSASCFIAALAGVFVYLSAKELFSRNVALLTTFIFAFATSTWSVSSQALWQHGTVELLLAALLWLIIRNEKQESLVNIAFLGILSGLFVFNRPPDSILLIPVLAYIVLRQKSRVPWFLGGAVVAGLPFFWYNFSLFGNVFGGYSENLALFSLNMNFIANYLGLLISPNVGLFVYCPVLLLSLAGYYIIYRKEDSPVRTILLLAGIAVLLEILMYSFFTLWSSSAGYCYGTRFLTGLIPILCLAVGFFLEDWFGSGKSGHPVQIRRIAAGIVAALIIISVCIQAIGFYLYPFSEISNMTMDDERAWSVTDSVIVRSYTESAGKISGVSIYVLPPLSPLWSWNFGPGGS